MSLYNNIAIRHLISHIFLMEEYQTKKLREGLISIMKIATKNCSWNVATPPKVNFGHVMFQLPPSIRSVLRKTENLWKKIINAEDAISFNKVCLSEDILPNYSNIYIYIYIYSLIVYSVKCNQVCLLWDFGQLVYSQEFFFLFLYNAIIDFLPFSVVQVRFVM